ncbi:MAG TPA: 4-hydroxybenzoate 3-monooxygenase [Polyangiaceae bacterium]|nr:4-hydroxybenzoate 3-monooxygenase [Polyangiaceae bacterium]
MNRCTQVVILGAGPSGLLLSHLLALRGVESVVLELRTRDYVASRIRAGVLEHGTVELLHEAGLGARALREGFVHEGVELAGSDGSFRVDFRARTGKAVTIYGQTELQKDLFRARDEANGVVIDEVSDVRIHDADTRAPSVTCTKDGESFTVRADFVAGCDGHHGVSRAAIPAPVLHTYERVYPFGWLGILSETPPVSDELIYSGHERGFALCSMRNPALSRYYVQCALGESPDAWSDARFWDELRARLPREAAERLVTGPSIEKSVTPLRSFIAEPMRFGSLFLAGDAAHIVPPTGAKGLNLAVRDVALLAAALTAFYGERTETLLDAYSNDALAGVWKAVRFSWWMTNLLHRYDADDDFARRLKRAELAYLRGSLAAQTVFAENYVGLAR